MTPAELQAYADKYIGLYPDPNELPVTKYWVILRGFIANKITVPAHYRKAMLEIAVAFNYSI
jgi:hypothetical protein